MPSWPAGMSGPPSDRPASPFAPELRLHKRSLQVRRGPGARLVLALAIGALMAPGAWLITVQPLVGAAVMALGALPAVALVRAVTWRRLATPAGWIEGDEAVPWDLVESLTLFRASADPAELALAGGRTTALSIRVPRRGAVGQRRIVEDVAARHLHQLGHALRRGPVPVWLDLGTDRERVPFDPRCLRCATEAGGIDHGT
ncbi:MAG: hypothetical protein R2701_06825 [Acidimicrobiales bacterium]